MNLTPLPAGSLRATSLNAARRQRELAQLAAAPTVDILVIGAGLLGSAIALDAAARGLSVALIDSGDIAAAPGGNSSGHLLGPLGLDRQGALERNRLMTRLAPHLAPAQPLVFPLRKSQAKFGELGMMSSLRKADFWRRAAHTPASALPPPQRLTTSMTRAVVPGLEPTGLRGGILAVAGAVPLPSRLALALARTAAGFGARVLPRVRVRRVEQTLALTDEALRPTVDMFELQARAVLNATGEERAGTVPVTPNGPLRTQLFVEAETLGLAETAVFGYSTGGLVQIVPEDSGLARVDSANDLDAEQLRAGMADLLGRECPASALVQEQRASLEPVGDFRTRAAQAVDVAIARNGLSAGASRTASIPLVGAASRPQLAQLDAEPRLIPRYGSEATRVSALLEVDPELSTSVAGSVTAAEVLWAVRHEGALTVDDVLDRRVGLGQHPPLRAAAIEPAARLVDRALAGVLSG